jgi:6-phospho-beta-glucosidase
VPADETLGPAGLRAALRAAPPLRDLAERLRAAAPDALVVNLTNPLSVTTAVLAQAGLRVWGLCELPLVTADSVAAMLGGDGVDWAYTGLNHRGFLHGLRHDGQDALPLLAAALPDRSRLGVTGEEVAALGALPLKYFSLFAGDAPHGFGRAAELDRLRATTLGELECDPKTRPPSLAEREAPWYTRSVGPVLAAAVSCAAVDTVVNVADDDGVVRERRARAVGSECLLAEETEPPAGVLPWLDRFVAHEKAVLAAVDDPCYDTVLAACAADPLLPERAVTDAARLLTAAA